MLVVLLVLRALMLIQETWKTDKEGPTNKADDLVTRLVSEARAMADHALSKGLRVEPSTLVTICKVEALTPRTSDAGQVAGTTGPTGDECDITEIAAAHRHLVDVVHPATPSTLLLLRTGDENPFFRPLGRVRLIRHMLYVAIVFLVSVVALTVTTDPLNDIAAQPAVVSPSAEPGSSSAGGTEVTTSTVGDDVSGEGSSANDGDAEQTTTAEDVAASLGSNKPERLWNALFLVSLAGLGAAFYALYTATRFVKNNSYDQQFEPTYWMRFVLGLVGGYSLSIVVGDQFINDETIGTALLAFIGGFSADVVYQVLQRIVETIDTLVRGSSKDRVDQQVRAARERANTEIAEQRLRLASPLIALETKLDALDTAEVRSRLAEIINKALPYDGEPGGGESGDGEPQAPPRDQD